jgi:hypothetical protein
VARLHEDVGSGAALIVDRMSFEQPTNTERLKASSEYAVPPAGGLYVARLGDFTSAIILPPAVRRLDDLRCAPRIDGHGRSVEALLGLIDFAYLWGTARLPGDLFSAARQCAVLHALTSQIFRILGGDAWGDAEAAARARKDGVADLKGNVSRKREEAAVGAALALECDALTTAAQEARIKRVAALVGRFVSLPSRSATKAVVESEAKAAGLTILRRVRAAGPDDALWLAELALRLASDPAHVKGWAGEHLHAGVTRLLEVSTLARAARFLVLATDHRMSSRAAAGELYAGWGWQ